MCCGDTSSALSRTGILLGLISVTTLVTAFVSNVWLFTKEPILLPNSNTPTTVSFKIGLWRVCPSIKRINNSQNIPSPACTLIKYSNWEEIRHSDLGIWTHLDFTPAVVTRMRLSTPFEGLSLALMILATFYAVVGHCNSDKKTLVACALYTLAGLCLAGGLLIFASVLSDAFFGLPHLSPAFSKHMSSSYLTAQSNPAPTVDYKYGWSFFAAGAAFILTEIAAVFTISAYLRRYRSVEEMVSIMVPGARRKLCEINVNYAKKKTEHAGNQTRIDEIDAFEPKKQEDCLPMKAPPDICSGAHAEKSGQERNLLLVPRESPKFTADGVDFHLEEFNSSEPNEENFLIESNSGTDLSESVGTTVPIKVKPPGKYTTLNNRPVHKSTFQGNAQRSFCKEELLPQCNVKCCTNATFAHSRYTNTNSLPHPRFGLRAQGRPGQGQGQGHGLEQGRITNHGYPDAQWNESVLEIESPSSSGSSVSCGHQHPLPDAGLAVECDCKYYRFRSLPRRKVLVGGARNSVHSLTLKCESQLPILPESALARDL